MRLGNVELFVVSDGTMWLDAGGVFGLVPRVLWERVDKPDPYNRIESALNCLLIASNKGNILVDTGLGDKLTQRQEENYGREGGSRLLDNLSRLGFKPEDIDIVIDTHLHAD